MTAFDQTDIIFLHFLSESLQTIKCSEEQDTTIAQKERHLYTFTHELNSCQTVDIYF